MVCAATKQVSPVNKVCAFLLILLLPVCVQGFIAQGDSTLRFAAFGHSYSILTSPAKRAMLVEAINRQQVDFVFILGDAECSIAEIYKEYSDSFEAPLICIAGNEDYPLEYGKGLKKNIYRDTVVFHDKATFVLLNSSNSKETIVDFLNSIDYSAGKPTYLLTHHRLWDDNLLSTAPFLQDKSYLFDEIFRAIDGRFDAIIAGNGSGQYFGDQNVSDSSKLNNNIVYWTDMCDGIPCYSVGMGGTRGMATNRVTWITGEQIGGELLLKPHSIILPEMGEHATNARTPLAESSGGNWLFSKLQSKSLWATFALGLLLGFLFAYRGRRKEK